MKRTTSRILMGSLVAFVCSLTGVGRAEEAAKAPAKVERKGPLAALPGAPGPTVEKIKALGDNQWVNLGSPAADPKWGRARGRGWGTKAFALVPELRGAYFAGEGIHAFVKPDGFGMDDYWFYDINAHRWICLYPGTDTKSLLQKIKDKEIVVDDNGQVVDKDGQPVPSHLLIHAWGYVTYDADQKKLVIFADGAGYGSYLFPGIGDGNPADRQANMQECLKLLGEQGRGKKKISWTPWFHDSMTGRFERHPASGPWPGATGAAGFPQFLYVSSRKQHFVGGADGVAFFDPAKRAWSVPKSQGPRPPGYDQRGCYDPKRDRVYMGGGIVGGEKGVDDGFYIYDLKTETWTKPEVKKETYPALCRIVHYDSVNDVVVMMHNDKKIYTYHPETNTWSEPLPIPDGVFGNGMCSHAFYDQELNAHFVFLAGDSVDNGTMWAYRYKKATK